jgi:hypothetical protein
MDKYDLILMKIEADFLSCEEQRQTYLNALIHLKDLINKNPPSYANPGQVSMINELIQILEKLSETVETINKIIDSGGLPETELEAFQIILNKTMIEPLANLEPLVRLFIETFGLKLDDFEI